MNERLVAKSAASERGTHGLAGDRGSAYSVLVVDDDPAIAAALRLLLLGEGYAVRTAADGRAAMESVRREPVDLLICDVTIPYIDGRTLVQRLRAEGVRTPAILMSALSRVEPLDGVPFIVKPFDIQRLLDLVAGALRIRATNG